MKKPSVAPPDDPDDVILSTKELTKRIPFTRQTIWREVRAKRFPPPIHLTNSRIGWRWSRVRAWLAEREARPLARRPYFPKDSEKKSA